MGSIHAIETVYKGYRFRSRLEARWAVFFDALGIRWEYEREGFDLGELGYYLPDFWLDHIHGDAGVFEGYWLEIKPANTPIDDVVKAKCFRLAQSTGMTCTLITGSPWPDEYSTIMFFGGYWKAGFAPWNGMNETSVRRAFTAARSARFEHGEKG